jgi:hypothetical protein
MTIFGGGETMMMGGVQPNSSLPSKKAREIGHFRSNMIVSKKG